MSKNISLSEEVYKALVREKGDRSFNELIAEKLDASGSLQEVTGQQILDEPTDEAVEDDIVWLSERTTERLDS
jgi:predicted CopG family antitoxin